MVNFYKSKFGNVYYELSGPEDALAVIFLHGVGMDHRTFEKRREALRRRYRTLESANHIANQDNPDQFNEALLNFLGNICEPAIKLRGASAAK